MSSTSGRHAREFYGADQNDEVAADYDEAESRPSGDAVSFTLSGYTAAITGTGTSVITANVKHAGVNEQGVTLTATSSDTDVATVTASVDTNASGNAAFTITGVAAGECDVVIRYGTLKLNRTVAVTVT